MYNNQNNHVNDVQIEEKVSSFAIGYALLLLVSPYESRLSVAL
jgi:hypothetical protein